MFSPGPALWILNWLRWELAFQLHLRINFMISRMGLMWKHILYKPAGTGCMAGLKTEGIVSTEKSKNTIKDFRNALQDHISCWIFWISETKNSRRLLPPENNPLSAFSNYMRSRGNYEFEKKEKRKLLFVNWVGYWVARVMFSLF